jgi:ABC-type phosphate/phosphonate transport system permease subunit
MTLLQTIAIGIFGGLVGAIIVMLIIFYLEGGFHD